MKQVLTLLIISCSVLTAKSQTGTGQLYTLEEFGKKLDSLRELNNHKVEETDDIVELASQLAILHYSELRNHRIKIIYRKGARYPITAGYGALNFFRFRKKHVYKLVIRPGTFVNRVSLNKTVAIMGHEMAHFVYYRKRPSIGMVWWGLKYAFSNKFRYRFEKDADRIAIDHGLGYQLLDLSFYMTNQEVREYIQSSNSR